MVAIRHSLPDGTTQALYNDCKFFTLEINVDLEIDAQSAQ